MILERYIKQPGETKDYDIDYGPWLNPMMDNLSHATAIVECLTNVSDTSLTINQVEFTTQKVKVWLSGGTDRMKYKVTVTAVTHGGRTDQSELLFVVKDF